MLLSHTFCCWLHSFSTELHLLFFLHLLLGTGGIPYGDKNDEITLTKCAPIGSANEIDPTTVKRPLWGTRWTLPIAYEVLIGPKKNPFCFATFPAADSVL